jgi:ankyrin repeat protein
LRIARRTTRRCRTTTQEQSRDKCQKQEWLDTAVSGSVTQLKVAGHLLNFKLKDESDEISNVPVDVNAQSHNKNTPLHVASIAGKLQIVELLLRHNAKWEIKGEHELTPLEAS